jgi:predicted phosphodiesterase
MPTVAALLGAIVLSGAAATTLPEARHAFHFVVLGDSQFHDPAGFNRLVDDVRSLRPAFVLQVGDMITGYTDSADTYRAEWRRYKQQIAPLGSVRFIPVPGNHDLYGANKVPASAALAIYEDEWGPAYRAFTYANALFVVLNTDAPNAEARIDTAQWQWLESTLKKNKATHKFAFMHRPPSSLDNAKALHGLFVEHGVSHVFYGHHHHYHYTERDGVRYVMTNAAANSGTDWPEVGSFDHLLQVAVHDDEVSIAVIKADSIVRADSVSPEDNYQLFSIVRQLTPKRIEAVSRSERGWMTTLTLSNPASRNVTVYTECSSPDHRWRVSPARIPSITLAAREKQQIQLEWSYAEGRIPEGSPSCRLTVPFQTSQGGWLNQTIDVEISGLTAQ